MTDNKGKRVVEEYSGKVEATPDKVFPLLCPTAEYDWLEGWACDLIYSESGFAENNCIFKTEFVGGIEATWIVSDFNEENFTKQFTIFYSDLSIDKIDVSLTGNEDNTTTVRWVRTATGLSQKGNQLIEHSTGEAFRQRMAHLVEALNHYCRTGEKLIIGGGSHADVPGH